MKHLVITGGHGGLARAITEAFTSPDWTIAAPAHAELDITDPKAIQTFFDSRPTDLLVCAAGIIRDAPLHRATEESWDEVFAVNYQGTAACAAAVLPAMIERGTGHIIFISSYSAIHPPIGQASYAAAKAALIGLAQTLARQNGTHGIRVNTILPGFLETGMTQSVSPARKSEILRDHHLGRFNTPAAVASFIRHLHDALPHTSGQLFQLDSR